MRRLLGSLGAIALAGALLASCGDAMTATAMPQPMDDGDVVYSGVGPVEAKNIQRFEAFIAVTESGGDDAVRIVDVTFEGAEVYTDLLYSEGAYAVYYDASEDPLSGERGRERSKVAECGKLEWADEPDGELRRYACGGYEFFIRGV